MKYTVFLLLMCLPACLETHSHPGGGYSYRDENVCPVATKCSVAPVTTVHRIICSGLPTHDKGPQKISPESEVPPRVPPQKPSSEMTEPF